MFNHDDIFSLFASNNFFQGKLKPEHTNALCGGFNVSLSLFILFLYCAVFFLIDFSRYVMKLGWDTLISTSKHTKAHNLSWNSHNNNFKIGFKLYWWKGGLMCDRKKKFLIYFQPLVHFDVEGHFTMFFFVFLYLLYAMFL